MLRGFFAGQLLIFLLCFLLKATVYVYSSGALADVGDESLIALLWIGLESESTREKGRTDRQK